MSAIPGVINGTQLALYLNGEITMLSTNLNWSIEHGLRDTSCREGDSWATSMGGTRSWGVECSMMLAYRNAAGSLYNAIPGEAALLEIISKFIMKQKKVNCTVMFKNNPSGNPKWSGKAFVTSVSIDTPNESSSTFSVTLSGSGEWLKKITGPGN